MGHFYSYSNFQKNGIVKKKKCLRVVTLKFKKIWKKFGKNIKKNILYKIVYYYYQEFQIKPNLTRQ